MKISDLPTSIFCILFLSKINGFFASLGTIHECPKRITPSIRILPTTGGSGLAPVGNVHRKAHTENTHHKAVVCVFSRRLLLSE